MTDDVSPQEAFPVIQDVLQRARAIVPAGPGRNAHQHLDALRTAIEAYNAEGGALRAELTAMEDDADSYTLQVRVLRRALH